MQTPARNRLYVTLFLLFVVGFTALMTFYAGPRMMRMRDAVVVDRFLYKCQKVVDGNRLELQQRSSERPNPNPVVPVTLAAVSSPPRLDAEDPLLLDWAAAHGVEPERAAMIGESAHQTLLAFIRKQNLRVERVVGENMDPLTPGAGVHVVCSGTRVGLKQLENGLAVHLPDVPQRHPEAYQKAQAEAKAAQRGLWAP